MILYPLLLGTGERFFKAGREKTDLRLKRTDTSGSGVTMLVCEPAH